MRFVASPLLVAVALGLLGPSVLDTEDEEQEEVLPREQISHESGSLDLDVVAPEGA